MYLMLCRGGGLLVSELAFKAEDPSSNPADYFSLTYPSKLFENDGNQCKSGLVMSLSTRFFILGIQKSLKIAKI